MNGYGGIGLNIPGTMVEAVMQTRAWKVGERCPTTILRRSYNTVFDLEPASAAKRTD